MTNKMLLKTSHSDQCPVSNDDSEVNFIPGKYFVIESKIIEASNSENGADDTEGKTNWNETASVEQYSYEPIAYKDWRREYIQRQAEKEHRLASLQDRLAGREDLEVVIGDIRTCF